MVNNLEQQTKTKTAFSLKLEASKRDVAKKKKLIPNLTIVLEHIKDPLCIVQICPQFLAG